MTTPRNKYLQTIVEEILLDPNRKITTEDMMDDILNVLPPLQRRVYFDDATQSIVEQACLEDREEPWISVKKTEFIEDEEEYFKRKLQGK